MGILCSICAISILALFFQKRAADIKLDLHVYIVIESAIHVSFRVRGTGVLSTEWPVLHCS